MAGSAKIFVGPIWSLENRPSAVVVSAEGAGFDMKQYHEEAFQPVKPEPLVVVADHTKSSAELRTAATAATPVVTLPAVMPAELQAKLDALKAAKGADFDALFLEQQKDGHSKALDALNSYSSSGDAASLKAFADKAIPVVQGHLDKLNAMKL